MSQIKQMLTYLLKKRPQGQIKVPESQIAKETGISGYLTVIARLKRTGTIIITYEKVPFARGSRKAFVELKESRIPAIREYLKM